MKRNVATTVLLAIVTCSYWLLAANGQAINPNQTQNRLSNDDVVAMVKSGLASEIIVAKIKNSDCRFDTSPSALKDLKEAGVPEAVILAMVQSPSVNTASTPNTEKTDKVNAGAENSKVTIYVYRRKEFNTRNMQPSVYVDGTEVARMDDGKFFIVTLEPGKHKVFVNKEYSGAEVDMKPGEEYYFRVSIKPGFWKGRGEIDFVQKEQGVLEIKKMKPLEEKWIKDKSRVTVEDNKIHP